MKHLKELARLNLESAERELELTHERLATARWAARHFDGPPEAHQLLEDLIRRMEQWQSETLWRLKEARATIRALNKLEKLPYLQEPQEQANHK